MSLHKESKHTLQKDTNKLRKAGKVEMRGADKKKPLKATKAKRKVEHNPGDLGEGKGKASSLSDLSQSAPPVHPENLWEQMATRVWSDEQFRQKKRAEWEKWRVLAKDKYFILETAALKIDLSSGFARFPDVIKRCFQPAFVPFRSETQTVSQWLVTVHDPKLRSVLERYVRYVWRFGVQMTLFAKKPYFRTSLLAAPLKKLRVAVVKNHFDFLDSEDLQVGPKMQNYIDSGRGRYIQIDDNEKRSLLKELVQFGYSSNEITFISLMAGQPIILCLVGEGILVDKTWKGANRAVRELQDKHFNRVQAGKPHKRAWKKRLARMVRGKGSTKVEAIRIMDRPVWQDVQKKTNSAASSLSQLKRTLQLQFKN